MILAIPLSLNHCHVLTQLLEEGRVPLALRCQVFLCKVQGLLHLAQAHQLYQTLLLEMEGQLRLQLQDLQACTTFSAVGTGLQDPQREGGVCCACVRTIVQLCLMPQCCPG